MFFLEKRKIFLLKFLPVSKIVVEHSFRWDYLENILLVLIISKMTGKNQMYHLSFLIKIYSNIFVLTIYILRSRLVAFADLFGYVKSPQVCHSVMDIQVCMFRYLRFELKAV